MDFKKFEQEYGYCEVTTDSKMFFWLHYALAAAPENLPIIIWLNGSAGSATGVGAFMEVGSVDMKGNQRNEGWKTKVNILFIDAPIGCGFSYVDNASAYAKTYDLVGRQVLHTLKYFFKKYEKFQNTDVFIFGGGFRAKIAVHLALVLDEAIKESHIKCNLRGLALGNPWISPIDSMTAWSNTLFYYGLVDEYGRTNIANAVNKVEAAVNKEQYVEAYNMYKTVKNVVETETNGVDYNNITFPVLADKSKYAESRSPRLYKVEFDRSINWMEELNTCMEDVVCKALNIPKNVKYEAQADEAYEALSSELLVPAYQLVGQLLDKQHFKVVVYSGNLDLTCPTKGAEDWISKMKWKDLQHYVSAQAEIFNINKIVQGYVRTAKTFSFYRVKRAGLMVGMDNPAALNYIITELLKPII